MWPGLRARLKLSRQSDIMKRMIWRILLVAYVLRFVLGWKRKSTQSNNRAKARAVKAENPLFQSMGAEETAVVEEPAAAAITTEWAKQATERAAAETEAQQTAIREHNPLFQSMGAEEAAMAVADKVEEVAAVEMAVTVMAAANTAADTAADTAVAATAQDTAQDSTEEQAT